MSVVTTTPDPTILGPALGGTVPAPVGRRIGASLIDGGLLLVVEAVGYLFVNDVMWGFAFPLWAPLFRAVSSVVGYSLAELLLGTYGVIGLLVVAWGAVQWRLHAKTGQTIGKRAVGIRTLAVPGGTAPGAGRTLGRYLLLGVAGFVPLGGLLMVLSVFWDPDRLLRGWHDKAANVVLIDIRAGRDPLAARPGLATVGAPVRSEATPHVPAATPHVPAAMPRVPSLPVPVSASVAPHGPSAPAPWPVAPPEAAAPVPSPVAPRDVVIPALSAPDVVTPGRPAAAAPAAQAQPVPAPPGGAIISSVPGRPSGGGAGAVPPPPPPPPPVAPAGVRPAAPTAAGPFSPLPAPPVADDDDAELTVASLAIAAPVADVQLVFDDGATLPVSGRGRIGRDPVVGAEPVTHLVPLTDASKSVSKTHLEFTLADGGLWVCDLHSTNGSSIEHAGTRTALVAGEWVRAEPGAIVHVGSRTFRVEAP